MRGTSWTENVCKLLKWHVFFFKSNTADRERTMRHTVNNGICWTNNRKRVTKPNKRCWVSFWAQINLAIICCVCLSSRSLSVIASTKGFVLIWGYSPFPSSRSSQPSPLSPPFHHPLPDYLPFITQPRLQALGVSFHSLFTSLLPNFPGEKTEYSGRPAAAIYLNTSPYAKGNKNMWKNTPVNG